VAMGQPLPLFFRWATSPSGWAILFGPAKEWPIGTVAFMIFFWNCLNHFKLDSNLSNSFELQTFLELDQINSVIEFKYII
jgi:hypothetical protein